METAAQKVITIRDRNQITIPFEMSKTTLWLKPRSVVVITKKNNEISIKPYRTDRKTLNNKEWDEIWRELKKVRSYRGKYKGSLSDFVIKDRERH